MTKSDYVFRLGEIQKIIKQLLANRGFKQQQRSFCRSVEPGLTQVIHFGMAGSTSSHYGKFTVDIGIYIQEVYLHCHSWEKNEPKNISTRHCEISRRLPSFVPGVEDKWWNLGEPIGTIAEELIELLLNHGLPFLESLTTRRAIVEKWEQNKKSLGLPPREKVSMAIIYAYLGNKNKASALLRADLEKNRTQPYSDFIQEISVALDLKIEN